MTLHIISSLGQGGAERTLFNYLKNVGENSQHAVLSLTEGGVYLGKLEKLGIDVFVLNFKAKPLASMFLLLRLSRGRLLPTKRIVGWMYHGSVFAFITSIIIKGKIDVIWNIRHSLYDLRYEKISLRILIKILSYISPIPSAIIFNSKKAIIEHELVGFNVANAIHIPNGVDIEYWKSTEANYQRRLESFGEKRISFVYVGRNHPMKNQRNLLMAVKKLCFDNDRLRFHLIGRNLAQLAMEMGLVYSDRIIFHGEVEVPKDILVDCHYLILTSQWGEGWPNVIGEAMSLGIPCISTNVGDSVDIIGSHGFCIKGFGKDDIVKAITESTLIESWEYEEMLYQCRNVVEESYSLDKMIGNYNKLLN